MNQLEHKSVLLNEIVAGLEITDGDVYVDMTLGGGGHALGMVASGAKNLTIIGLDADDEAETRTKSRFENELPAEMKNNFEFIFANTYFDDIDRVLTDHKINKIDKVLFDLGYSSFEIDSPDRGFSFLQDGPLKMTYSNNPTESQLTAHDVVNFFSETNLADIIYGFGEEKFSRRIAKGIVEAREKAEIQTTSQLAHIISESVPYFYRHHKDGGRSKIHPATKTFQAIRIAVNSELERLKIALNKTFEKLNSGGKIAVISFHSLEDRIVKRFFKEKISNNEAELINKKPIIPTEKELQENPRSRSAKLRIIKKI
jgi:16S rRNA (cytosine1402-N4)-methyltransferase